MKKIFQILIGAIIMLTDRLCRFYRIDKEQPSIHDLNTFPYLKKDIIKRTIVRVIVVIITLVIYYLWLLIKYLLT